MEHHGFHSAYLLLSLAACCRYFSALCTNALRFTLLLADFAKDSYLAANACFTATSFSRSAVFVMVGLFLQVVGKGMPVHPTGILSRGCHEANGRPCRDSASQVFLFKRFTTFATGSRLLSKHGLDPPLQSLGIEEARNVFYSHSIPSFSIGSQLEHIFPRTSRTISKSLSSFGTRAGRTTR
jgi:hypothetical protein